MKIQAQPISNAVDSGSRQCRLWGGCLAALAVALGAFGAHGLQDLLTQWYPEEVAKKLATWNTAVDYQMYSALGLLLIGWVLRPLGRLGRGAALGLGLGTLVFSGLLYGLVLADIKILGAIVPLGGVAMIVGWLLLGCAGWIHGQQRAG